MRVEFPNEAQSKWAYESIHLYRTWKYLTFKKSMEFPQFVELTGEEQNARCKEHNALIFRFKEWLDELKLTQGLSVKDHELELMADILRYRPFHFVPPESVVSEQLDLLSGKHA